MNLARHFLLLVLTLIGLTSANVSAQTVTLEISAGQFDRQDDIISMPIPRSLRRANGYQLKRVDTGKEVPIQGNRGKLSSRLIWILDEPLKAQKKRRYQLSAAPAATVVPDAKRPPISVSKTKYGIVIAVAGRKVLHFNSKIVPSPIPEKPFYQRSGYIHPVYNPAGQPITDDFAPDHPHQHGIMYAWTRTEFQGRRLNFWEQGPGTGGKIVCVAGFTLNGPVFGGVYSRLNHLDHSNKNKPLQVITEQWLIRVYPFQREFIFDLESTQKCTTNSPLRVLQHHYGGMAIRGNRGWTEKVGQFLTSEGKTRSNGNHTRPRWVDIHGPINGKMTGMTVFCHPQNFRFPQSVRLHPKMPYFCFAPMVNGPWMIRPRQPFRCQYRFYVHMGKLNKTRADQLWNAYRHPIQVSEIQ